MKKLELGAVLHRVCCKGILGLVVKGGDSPPRDCGFESRHRILDGYFHINCCKNCNVSLKRPKINEKEAGDGPLTLTSIASSRVSTEMTQRTGPKISVLYAFMPVFMSAMMVGPKKLPFGYFSTVTLRPSSCNDENTLMENKVNAESQELRLMRAALAEVYGAEK